MMSNAKVNTDRWKIVSNSHQKYAAICSASKQILPYYSTDVILL